MRCGEKVLMDLYDFIAQYDVEESAIYFVAAGKDKDGKDRYTFYVSPKYVNGYYSKDFYSVTLAPEISSVMIWGSGTGFAGYKEIQDFSFEGLIEPSGVGVIRVAERLYFSDRSREKKTDVFTIDSMYDFRVTIANTNVEVERIPKKEFTAIQNTANGTAD